MIFDYYSQFGVFMDSVERGYDYLEDNTLFYGEIPHRRAVEIADYEFFWDNLNELAPFGSEEGYIAFTELAQWMRNNPQVPMIEYVKWVLECWDINFEDFDDSIIEPENICKIINDLDFDEELMMLDVTIIASGFGQLVLKGRIDENVKNVIHLSLLRQMNSYVLDAFLGAEEEMKYERYLYLQKLLEILEEA